MFENFLIGAKIEGDFAHQIYGWQQQQKNFDSEDIHWLKPESFHVTFIPPWFSEPKQLEIGLQKFEIGLRYWKIGPFEVNFNTIKFGPDFNKPQFIMATGPKTHDIGLFEEILSFDVGYYVPPTGIYPYIPIASLSGTVNEDFIEGIDWHYNICKIYFMKTNGLDEKDYQVVKEFDLEHIKLGLP